MATTDRNGQPVLARRNTFQRMLDLERKHKVNRLQGQPPPAMPQSRTSTMSMEVNHHSYQTNQTNHSKPPPAMLANHNRTMTAPSLSIAVPPSPDSPALVKEGNNMKKYVIKAGGAVPQTEGGSGDESDRSSICHSPGWEDITGNKKKQAKQAAKDKKKAEKKKLEAVKKAETEAKYAARMKNRLSKAPPTSDRFRNMPPMDRSASSPAVQSTPPETSPKDDGKKSANRSRRGSIDLSLKNFLHSGKKTNNNAASPQITPAKEAPPAGGNNGFIGGLKLRLSEEASNQDRVRQSVTHDRPSIAAVKNGSSSREPSSNPSIVNRQRQTAPTSMYVESSRTPAHWDGGRSNTGKFAEVDMKSSIPDDGPRKTNPGKARQSMFPQMPTEARDQHVPSSRRDASSSSKNRYPPSSSRPRTSGEISNYPRGSSPNSVDRSSIKSRDRSSDSRGRDNGSYVQNQRIQSTDRAVAAFKDDYRFKTSSENNRERSPSFHSVKSQMSNEVPSKPATQHISTQAKHPGDTENPFSFFSEYTPPKLELEDRSPSRSPALPEMVSSNQTQKAPKGLKGFAKSVFSKQSPMASPARLASPSAHSFVSSIFDTVENPASTKRKPGTPVTDTFAGRFSKTDKFLGEDFPPELQRSAAHHGPSNHPAWKEQGARSGSHARTATDSSEEYSTLDEFSNVTTPMASRPQSQKEYFPPMSSLDPKHAKLFTNGPGSSTTSLPHQTQKPTMMSGAIHHVSNRSQDDFSRTAMPMEFVDDEERTQTPTGHRSLTGSTTAPNLAKGTEKPKESKSASALQRQLSLNRSASTPELQDLSFLPALKHQALTKPEPKKAKGGILKHFKGKESAQPRDPVTRELIKPRPISQDSEAPPDSPSSTYLRDARLGLPRPPQISKTGRGSPSTQLAHPSATPEPIAKMFVVCCSCKYFHDMPSKIYECMAKPDNVVEDKHLGVSGVISTSVKCPWCGHGMSTTCCAGYAAVVYLREKLH